MDPARRFSRDSLSLLPSSSSHPVDDASSSGQARAKSGGYELRNLIEHNPADRERLQDVLTATQSLQSIQTLLRAGLGCITYLR